MQLLVDGHVAELEELRIVRDGCVCWYQRTRLDCMRACAATVTQVAYEDVDGDLQTPEELEEWAQTRGLQLRTRADRFPAGFWIGVCPAGADRLRHTFVGRGNELFFDPASGWRFGPYGLRPDPPTEVDYILTLEPACSR